MAETTAVESSDSSEERRTKILSWRKELHQKILDSVGIGRTMGREELASVVQRALTKILDNLDIPEFITQTKDELRKDTIESILGFGPLEDLLRDPTVNDIMVNAY